MEAHSLNDTELWQLVGFIQSLETSGDSKDSGTSDAKAELHVSAPYEEIAAIREPTDWLTFSGSYSGSRHSALRQINPDNVSPACAPLAPSIPG